MVKGLYLGEAITDEKLKTDLLRLYSSLEEVTMFQHYTIPCQVSLHVQMETRVAGTVQHAYLH